MLEVAYQQLDPDFQLTLADVVANATFRGIISELVDGAQEMLLDLDAEGLNPEDFRVEFAVHKARLELMQDLLTDLQTIKQDLENRMREGV